MVNRRYSYLPECKWLLEATDMHHVVVRKSNAKDFFICLSALIVVPNAASYLFLVKWKNCPSLYSIWQDFETFAAGMCIPSYLLLELVSASAWRSRTSCSFSRLRSRNVELGVVASGPSRGIEPGRVLTQLDASGLNPTTGPGSNHAQLYIARGCVHTPSLTLGPKTTTSNPTLGVDALSPGLRGILCKYIFRKELKKLRGLEVEELRPHVKMLILIWNALCDASGIKEGSDTWEDAT
ncbi:hypothetical protein NC651_017223 [Populus alba x Populus x berolinensis]|nr:hypothetical protein NC651_017223 [Populus alba x Populus x berolinensis]